MHAICCALLLQPVLWHVKKSKHEQISEIECDYCKSVNKKDTGSIFSSQFLFNVDDKNNTGYEIIDPGTPMLARYNDGWYSSSSAKRSLYSSKISLQNLGNSRKESYTNLGSASERKSKGKIMEFPLDDVKGLNFTDQLPYHKNSSVTSFKNYKTSPATPMASRNSFVLPQISENQYMRDNHSVRSYVRHPSISRKRNNFNQEEQGVSH